MPDPCNPLRTKFARSRSAASSIDKRNPTPTMKPTTRITDAGPKRCLNGIFEILESFSTGSTSACALESYHASPVSHSRANPARSEAGRGQRVERGPEEEANWLPAPTLLTLADEVIE